MTWRAFTLAGTLLCAIVGTSFAGAPSVSPRPQPKPFGTAPERPAFAVFDTSTPGLKSVKRPRAKPARQPSRARRGDSIVFVAAGGGVGRSVRPRLRPANEVKQVAIRTQPSPIITKSRTGSICGVRSIQGVRLSPIAGRITGCGVSNPVKVSSVDGVVLSQAAILDCKTAKALNTWVKKGVKPTVGRLGGGVSGLKVASHYSCRTRNSRPGAKISEHGKGHAIDIAAINLKNGSSITVLGGWRKRTHGKLLKAMHKSACGPFGTVLGPNADKYHRDHFHLDTARHRGGSYCR